MIKPFRIKDKEIKIPIVQGAMGVGVSLENLSSAVINEGAMGTISTAQIGFRDESFFKNPKMSYEANVRELKETIRKVRSKSDGFLAVNILTATRCYDMLAQAAVEAGADAIVSGAGLPIDMPKATANSATAAIPIVSSARALNIICRKWKKKYNVLPDSVIVEGPMAGGHLGIKYDQIEEYREFDNLDERFKEVKKYCIDNDLNIPIIVAGGVFTTSDVKKYLDLGADAVQLGTRFIATDECDAAIEFKEMIVNSTKDDIVYVKSPVGYPARAIKNSFTKKLNSGNIEVDKCLACVIPCKGKNKDTVYCITDHLIASVTGDKENGLFFSGANGYRVDKIVSVQELIQELLSDVRSRV